jgi:hypothetical protein
LERIAIAATTLIDAACERVSVDFLRGWNTYLGGRKKGFAGGRK